MAFDTVESGAGNDLLTPAHIAHNDLFSPREKMDLLNQLRSDARAAGEEGREPSFDLDQIDRAIAQVRQSVQDGVAGEHLHKGDK